jgi:hypothetical protein
MTPLIMQVVKYMQDTPVEQYAWFDTAEQWASTGEAFDHDRSLQALQNPLPFDKCSIVGRDDSNAPFFILVSNAVLPSNGEDGLVVHMQILYENGLGIGVCPPFFISPAQALRENDSDGMPIYFADENDAKDPRNVEAGINALVGISFWLEKLNQNTMPTYTATPKSNNAKRIRQGKKPMFDWHTVIIEPPKPKAEAQGGTHASPRLHDVRGHWVQRGDKRFWRKAHQRGDASIGVVFHDYKLKGEANEL